MSIRFSQLTAKIMALLALLGGQQAEADTRYAIMVGIEDYEHIDLRTPPLRYAVDDAAELANVLTGHGYKVALLTDDAGRTNAQAKPTRENIYRIIKRVLAKCKRGDVVVIGFAGHGLQFAGEKDAYFCPVDAKPFARTRDTLVSIREVYGELETSNAGAKIVLVDACRNDPDPTRGRDALSADTVLPPRGVGVLFSCAPGQKAFENDMLKHGIFFHHVIEKLRTPSLEGVDYYDLAGHVSRNVPPQALALSNRQQTPNQQGNVFGSLMILPPLKPSASRIEGTAAGEKRLHSNDLRCPMVWCPPGKFEMGSIGDESEQAVYINGASPRQVELSKGFWIGQYEITWRDWVSVMQSEAAVEDDSQHQIHAEIVPGFATSGDRVQLRVHVTLAESEFLQLRIDKNDYSNNYSGLHFNGVMWGLKSDSEALHFEPTRKHDGTWGADDGDRPVFGKFTGDSTWACTLVATSPHFGINGRLSHSLHSDHWSTLSTTRLRSGVLNTASVLYAYPGQLRLDRHPITDLSWDEAILFCKALTSRHRRLGIIPSDWRYSLPTEAQWEYACRAGTDTDYSFGDHSVKIDKYAWCHRKVSVPNFMELIAEQVAREKARITKELGASAKYEPPGYPTDNANQEEWQAYFHRSSGLATYRDRLPNAIGGKLPNPWGLYDMHGNVAEWCADTYSESLTFGTDPYNYSTKESPVRRGGSFVDPAMQCSSTSRGEYLKVAWPFREEHGQFDVGFRIVLAPEN